MAGSDSEVDRIARIRERLDEAFGAAPRFAVVLGSGLGSVTERVRVEASASFSELGLPQPSVVGHGGTVHVGMLGGHRVAIVAGRVHLYEGHAPAVVVRGVRALATWGVRTVLLTNAAGGLRPDRPPGTVVRIVDHLNLTGANPLVGPAIGTRFPDVSRAWYSPLGGALDEAALALDLELPHGVYAGLLGPSYETAAEVAMLRQLGADVVGMSTVHEALACRALDLSLAGLAVVTNYGAGVSDDEVDHAAVTRVAAEAARRVADLIEHALSVMSP